LEKKCRTNSLEKKHRPFEAALRALAPLEVAPTHATPDRAFSNSSPT
jgi:hypothetical protein